MGQQEKPDNAGRDADEKERNERPKSAEEQDEERDLEGLGQAGTSEPQPGIAENQGGGIEDAIGGGQSGQGGG